MNRQREIIVTVTYNELGIIIDTKAELCKTGRWICGDTGLMVTEYKCSECGRTVRDDTGYDVYKDYPYCHCGAEMRKDGEE